MKCFSVVCLLCIFLSIGAAQIPTNGLIAYYPMNGNAGDSSGFGHHGVVTGPTLTQDRLGNPNRAYKFNGISDKIVCAGLHPPVNNFSFSLWIKPDSFRVSDYKQIIGDAGGYRGFRVFQYRDGVENSTISESMIVL